MTDEKYHIEDIDDVDIVISGGPTSDKKIEHGREGKDVSKAMPQIKSKVIYESSDDYSIYDDDVYDDFYKDIYENMYDEVRSKKYKKKKSNRVYLEDQDPFKRHNSQWDRMVKETGDYIVRTSYRKPNTFKATLVGLLLGIMILILGFAKTLLVGIVVFIANMIGQLLDENPKVLSILDFFVRKFK